MCLEFYDTMISLHFLNRGELNVFLKTPQGNRFLNITKYRRWLQVIWNTVKTVFLLIDTFLLLNSRHPNGILFESRKKKNSSCFVPFMYIFYSYYIPLMFRTFQVVIEEKWHKSMKMKCSELLTVLSEIVWFMILLSKLHRGKICERCTILASWNIYSY